MKKIVTFLICSYLALAVVYLYSFEGQARLHMRSCLNEENGVSISHERIMVSNDSMVVIHCIIKETKPCGETMSESVEYIYAKNQSEVYGYVNKGESVVAIAELEGLRYNKNGRILSTPEFHGYVMELCKANGKVMLQF